MFSLDLKMCMFVLSTISSGKEFHELIARQLNDESCKLVRQTGLRSLNECPRVRVELDTEKKVLASISIQLCRILKYKVRSDLCRRSSRLSTLR